MSVQYVGEVVTVVAFLWVDIEEEGLVARGDTGERKKERKRSRKSMGGKEDFIFGGWLEVRSFSIPPSPPCSSSFSFSSFLFFLLLLFRLFVLPYHLQGFVRRDIGYAQSANTLTSVTDVNRPDSPTFSFSLSLPPPTSLLLFPFLLLFPYRHEKKFIFAIRVSYPKEDSSSSYPQVIRTSIRQNTLTANYARYLFRGQVSRHRSPFISFGFPFYLSTFHLGSCF